MTLELCAPTERYRGRGPHIAMDSWDDPPSNIVPFISSKGKQILDIPSGKCLQKNMERSTMLLMGKSTISMAMFNSYVSLPESIWYSDIVCTIYGDMVYWGATLAA